MTIRIRTTTTRIPTIRTMGIRTTTTTALTTDTTKIAHIMSTESFMAESAEALQGKALMEASMEVDTVAGAMVGADTDGTKIPDLDTEDSKIVT